MNLNYIILFSKLNLICYSVGYNYYLRFWIFSGTIFFSRTIGVVISSVNKYYKHFNIIAVQIRS